MNPKDEVKFEDIKKLVNASLEKFYKNDRDLIEMSNEEDMISEQCMVCLLYTSPSPRDTR